MSPDLTEQSKTPEHGEHSPREVARKITGVVLEQLKKLKREQSSDSDEVARVVSELAQTDFAKLAQAVMDQVERPAETITNPDGQASLDKVTHDLNLLFNSLSAESPLRPAVESLQAWITANSESLQAGNEERWKDLAENLSKLKSSCQANLTAINEAYIGKKAASEALERKHPPQESFADSLQQTFFTEGLRQPGYIIHETVQVWSGNQKRPALKHPFQPLSTDRPISSEDLEIFNQQEREQAEEFVRDTLREFDSLQDHWPTFSQQIAEASTTVEAQDVVYRFSQLLSGNTLLEGVIQIADQNVTDGYSSLQSRIRYAESADDLDDFQRLIKRINETFLDLEYEQDRFRELLKRFSTDTNDNQAQEQRELFWKERFGQRRQSLDQAASDQTTYRQLWQERTSLISQRSEEERRSTTVGRAQYTVQRFLESQSNAADAQTQYESSLTQALGNEAVANVDMSSESQQILQAVLETLRTELAGMNPDQVDQIQAALLTRIRRLQDRQGDRVRNEEQQRKELLDAQKKELLTKHPTIDVRRLRDRLSPLLQAVSQDLNAAQLQTIQGQLSIFQNEVDQYLERANKAQQEYASAGEDFAAEQQEWDSTLTTLQTSKEQLERRQAELRSLIDQKREQERIAAERQQQEADAEQARQEEQQRWQEQLQQAQDISRILFILDKLAALNTVWKTTNGERKARVVANAIRTAIDRLNQKDYTGMQANIGAISNIFGIRDTVSRTLQEKARAQQERDQQIQSALTICHDKQSSLEAVQSALQLLSQLNEPLAGQASHGAVQKYPAEQMLRNIQRVVAAQSFSEAHQALGNVTSIGDMDVKAYRAFLSKGVINRVQGFFRSTPSKIDGRM